ncbi:MAG: hypothetical protein D084_Lepto4C00616G0002 [Leptospirillum sp. Group IV 'UBA BS']|nr:MAG: hypothetical protein D084_Lepto4C00616G0002 [Leptospirillum sp. Group IV 'UBA BS']
MDWGTGREMPKKLCGTLSRYWREELGLAGKDATGKGLEV